MLDIDCQLALSGHTLRYQINTPSELTCLGIKGDSGCGKTTLLRIIAGLEQGATGTVRFAKQNWQNSAQKHFVNACDRHIGFVFQDARLFAHLTVEQNIYFRGNRRASTECQLDNIIETLDIVHLLKRRPIHLSGGEKQRVAIARALSSQPQYLIFDEPLTGIDYEQKQRILRYLATIKREFLIPMIYVSHIDEELQQLSDGIINLNHQTPSFTTLTNSTKMPA